MNNWPFKIDIQNGFSKRSSKWAFKNGLSNLAFKMGIKMVFIIGF